MSVPHRPLVERFQDSAHRHAVRWGVGVGVFVALALTALAAAIPSSIGLWPWIPLIVVVGVACGGAFFTAARYGIPLRYGSFEVPPETDAAALRAARRAVRKGELGSDPEVNRIAVGMAEAVLERRPPSRAQFVFVAVLAVATTALAVWAVAFDDYDSVIGPAGLVGLHVVNLALATRRRRRAAWLVDAYEGRTDRSQ